MDSNFDFYFRLFVGLDVALKHYIHDTVSNLISALTPVATSLLMILVMLWGWSMMRGLIQEPVLDALGRLLRMATVIGIALNLGYYNQWVVHLLWNSPDALAAAIAGGPPATGASQPHFLDSLMSSFFDMGRAYSIKAYADSGLARMAGLPNLGLWLISMTLWIAGIALTGYTAFLFALSKIALSIILGVGPIFILFTLFDATKRFFEAWLGQAMNYVFLVMLAAGAVKLVLTLIAHHLNAPEVVATRSDPSSNQALPTLAYCLISLLVLRQIPSMAAALGGGFAISTLGAVGWSYAKLRGAISSATRLARSIGGKIQRARRPTPQNQRASPGTQGNQGNASRGSTTTSQASTSQASNSQTSNSPAPSGSRNTG